MLENIRLSIQGIWSHKMRSFLTMLGVIIGIASIIGIVSTIEGTNQQIMQNLIGAGNNNVKITLMQGESEYWMDGGAPSGVVQISQEQKDEILALNDVENASFYNYRSYVDGVTNGTYTMNSGKAMGVDRNYLDTCGYVVYEGRNFVEKDYTDHHKVVLLDEAAAASLFPEGGALGKTIEFRSEPFTVIGLIKKADSFQPVINSFQDYLNYSQEEYGTVLMPDACWSIVFFYDEPQNAVVRTTKAEDMTRVGREAAEIMGRSVVSSDGDFAYKAEDLLERARNQQELGASTNNLLIWVASISLLVGGIGVMNIMLVSVTERTSEIGLKKAVGARKRKILTQFLTESAVLTSCGGVLGVIVGIILAQVIARMSGTPVAISIPAIIGSVAFSMLIGIVFGLLPSIKAANLNPIDALRRE
ncbi:MAG TPA: ABC transporter permease [Candidatus Scatomonas merdavium]|nr:ABC transporter permease [Candidatus Scatomonas merdavium]